MSSIGKEDEEHGKSVKVSIVLHMLYKIFLIFFPDIIISLASNMFSILMLIEIKFRGISPSEIEISVFTYKTEISHFIVHFVHERVW